MDKQTKINYKNIEQLRVNLGKSQVKIGEVIKLPKSKLDMHGLDEQVLNRDDTTNLSNIYNVNKEDIVIKKVKPHKKIESSRAKDISFDILPYSDLYLDATYEGDSYGNVKDDPLNKLLKCGNLGGFRIKVTNNKGSKINKYAYVVIYSDFSQAEWNDSIDYETGDVIYYGDNRHPGYELNEKLGNRILNKVFYDLDNGNRKNIPPFFLFTKGGKGRDVIFRGIAAPGAQDITIAQENLISAWYMMNGKRFQNYKARFTILDVENISREWINDLLSGHLLTHNTPEVYKYWIETGKYIPLKSEQKLRYRKKDEQVPKNEADVELINILHNHFPDPYDFEPCAAEIFKLMDPNVIKFDLTRRWSDGGRDALGKYRIGLVDNNIEVDFALEAKRYELSNAVKVKDTSRLISRLRNRQFGVLVTTSYVNHNAYKEIKDDGHPVIVICANDIIKILKKNGINTKENLIKWLNEQDYKNYKRLFN